MANWQKIIVSGSAAELASLILTTPLSPLYGGNGLQAASASGVLVGVNPSTYGIVGTNGIGRILRETGANSVIMSGSFSGSFIGNGAGLSGVNADSNFVISGSQVGFTFSTATDTLVFTTSSAYGFDLSSSFVGTRKAINLVAPQDLRTTATVTFNKIISSTAFTGSTLQLTGLGSDSTNTVLILGAGNSVSTRTIDSRVWGSSLVDGTGNSGRVTLWSDADTVTDNANFTYNGTIATINGSTFGQDVVIAGDLTVLGSVVQLQITNLNVEDRFIYLNSGSTTGDGGLMVGSGSLGNGVAFGWDDSIARWGFQQATLLTLSSSAMVPEAYAAAVVDVDGGLTDIAAYKKNGNIKIQSGEIYIYA
jgi:hypothetical protein